jgi:3-oxoacyl-[acyl-carrier-protein] synthase II
MPQVQDVVVTGMGVVCPIGVGVAAVQEALAARRSGVRISPELAAAGFPVPIAGEVVDFDAKQFVKPRKALKVMSRETQLGFAAAEMAWDAARLEGAGVDPERLGVTCGSNMFCPELAEFAAACHACDDGRARFDFSQWGRAGLAEVFPLWMLKYLPNMSPAHIGIAHDARGPSNSIVAGDSSGLLALIEAVDVVARGHADVMLAGGVSSAIAMMDLTWHACARLSRRIDEPQRASRPFDAERDGIVGAEGAAIFVLETRAHAEARGAKPIARILGFARRNEAAAASMRPTGSAIRAAIAAAMDMAERGAADLSHVSATGLSTPEDDAVEAQAIAATLGEVPVTAPKSFIGNVGAGSGAVELALNLASLEKGFVPPSLNYETPDPACPVNVVTEAAPTAKRDFIVLSHRTTGQATALVVEAHT